MHSMFTCYVEGQFSGEKHRVLMFYCISFSIETLKVNLKRYRNYMQIKMRKKIWLSNFSDMNSLIPYGEFLL